MNKHTHLLLALMVSLLLLFGYVPSIHAAPPAPSTNPDQQNINVPILMYHRIWDIKKGASARMVEMSISPKVFAAQMKYLYDNGYHTITLKQLFAYLQAKHNGTTIALPAKPIVISFDDGYKTQFYNALPVLQQYGFKATFYIIASVPGTADYMTWPMIQQLDAEGMDIESHTWSHKLLTKLDEASLTSELVKAKSELERRLGHSVDGFAYPYGGLNAHVIKAVAEAGYQYATIVGGGRIENYNKRFVLPRISVYGNFAFAYFVNNTYYVNPK